MRKFLLRYSLYLAVGWPNVQGMNIMKILGVTLLLFFATVLPACGGSDDGNVVATDPPSNPGDPTDPADPVSPEGPSSPTDPNNPTGPDTSTNPGPNDPGASNPFLPAPDNHNVSIVSGVNIGYNNTPNNELRKEIRSLHAHRF